MSGVVQERNQDATVYVGNVDDKVLETLLWELFLQAGPVVNVHMPKDRITQAHQGYGFVEYMGEDDADYAIKIMNMIKVFGKPIRVNKAASHNKNLDVGANMFIGNLDPDIDEKLLYDTFSAFGVILQTPKIMRDPETGTSKGFAFVNFASFDASDAAIEAMNGQYLSNRPISVSYAFKKETKGERHGSAAERLLATNNPLTQMDRPHQLFADAPASVLPPSLDTSQPPPGMAPVIPPPMGPPSMRPDGPPPMNMMPGMRGPPPMLGGRPPMMGGRLPMPPPSFGGPPPMMSGLPPTGPPPSGPPPSGPPPMGPPPTGPPPTGPPMMRPPPSGPPPSGPPRMGGPPPSGPPHHGIRPPPGMPMPPMPGGFPPPPGVRPPSSMGMPPNMPPPPQSTSAGGRPMLPPRPMPPMNRGPPPQGMPPMGGPPPPMGGPPSGGPPMGMGGPPRPPWLQGPPRGPPMMRPPPGMRGPPPRGWGPPPPRPPPPQN